MTLRGVHKERDGYNRPVPERLRHVFVGRRRLGGVMRDMERASVTLSRMRDQPWMAAMDVAGVQKMLAAARAILLRGAPFTPCTCLAEETDCPYCHGRRWVSIGNMPPGEIEPQ
jgi:hypothetical protein